MHAEKSNEMRKVSRIKCEKEHQAEFLGGGVLQTLIISTAKNTVITRKIKVFLKNAISTYYCLKSFVF
jgi:hypothetical protein